MELQSFSTPNICCENLNGTAENHTVDITKELKEKLHISTSNLANGYAKTLASEEVIGLELSVNGIAKCQSFDLPNSGSSNCLNNVSNRSNSYQDFGFAWDEIDKTRDTKSSSSEEHKDSNLELTDQCCTVDVDEDKTVVPRTESDNEHVTIIHYVGYESERQMPDIMRLIQKDLSEPYSIYTYRYFIHNWPKFCFLAYNNDSCVGAIVCKLDVHKKHSRRGYIAMLAVDERYRKQKIGSNLVLKAINAMIQDMADEVVLETEITNKPALRLYKNLGFVRDKRLFRYYLNGVDALRLKLWLR